MIIWCVLNIKLAIKKVIRRKALSFIRMNIKVVEEDAQQQNTRERCLHLQFFYALPLLRSSTFLLKDQFYSALGRDQNIQVLRVSAFPMEYYLTVVDGLTLTQSAVTVKCLVITEIRFC